MIDHDKKLYYGYPEDKLTLNQIIKAIRFSQTVEPWLEENIGQLGVKWFVEVDKEADSLRLRFADNETEIWFQFAWLEGAKKDYDLEE
jgi:hypothetical protein